MDIEQELKETSDLYIRLVRLADAGKINEAENLLYEQLENGQPEYLKAALGFYDHLNDYTEEFLDKADFSREEIKSGLVSVLRMYGYEGMTGLLKINSGEENAGIWKFILCSTKCLTVFLQSQKKSAKIK